LEKWERKIVLDPDNDKVYFNQGVVLSALGRKKEALESYDKALKINSNNVIVWNNKGVLLSNSGRKEEALKVTLKPSELMLIIRAGESYSQRSRLFTGELPFQNKGRLSPP
jgi:Flp pilus assembly protein TadD, contains TPR repeats